MNDKTHIKIQTSLIKKLKSKLSELQISTIKQIVIDPIGACFKFLAEKKSFPLFLKAKRKSVAAF